MNRVTASFTTSYSIYDSWAELLAGTRLLLNLSEDQGRDTIAKINLLRLVLVSSHQMTEVMFFSQLEKRIKQQSEVVKKLFEYDLEHRISFSDAIQKWPALITGRSLNFGSEPLQSMKSLSNHRNSAIHHTAKYPSGEFGESAFYTAIESSKAIFNHFNQGTWNNSEYEKFVVKNKPKCSLYLRKALQE